jgi:uncharacterized protein YjbI with pentapeptide repeats
MCKCNQRNCDLDVFENSDKCILHCEKDDWYEVDDNGNKNWDNKKIKFFWNQIKRGLDSKLQELDDSPIIIIETCIYDSVIFPEFGEDIIYNEYDNLSEFGTNFYSYRSSHNGEELNQIISELNVSFKNCKFLDNAVLSRYNFTKDLDFERCEFKKDLTLKKMIIEGNIELCDVKINGKLDLSETIFKDFSKVRIKDCEVKNADFYNTKFSNLADFFQTKFNEVNFKRTTFKDISVFTKVTFKDDIDFEYTTFEKLAQFKETIFEKKLNLEDTIIKDKINFLKTKTLNNENLKPENIANRETARIIKDSFEQQNNIIEANKFYALEMKEREKELEEDIKEGKNFLEWLVFKIHGISSNHSQDWLLALYWIFIIGFISSYYDFNLIQYEGKHYELSLVFKSIGLIFVVLFFYSICKIKDKLVNGSYFIICFYLVYTYSTEDYLLSLFSKTINPFSVMKTNDAINGIQLLFKIIIAYLIYQLIISIRQNTRRK